MEGCAGSDTERGREETRRTVMVPGGANREGARGDPLCGRRLERGRQHRKDMGGRRLQGRVDYRSGLSGLFMLCAAVVGGGLIVTGRMLRPFAARHAVRGSGLPSRACDRCSGTERQRREEHGGEQPPHASHSNAGSGTSRLCGRRRTPGPRQPRCRRPPATPEGSPIGRAAPTRPYRRGPTPFPRSRRSGDRRPR
jgi:hypothetical protein